MGARLNVEVGYTGGFEAVFWAGLGEVRQRICSQVNLFESWVGFIGGSARCGEWIDKAILLLRSCVPFEESNGASRAL